MSFKMCAPATSRRNFLKCAAAASAATLLANWPPAAASKEKDAAPADPYAGFKVGLQSYTLRGFDAKTAMQHTRTLGLKYWESFRNHIPVNTLPAHVEKQKALLDEHGLTLMAFGVENFNENETQARQLFDFGKAMGVRSISANPQKTAATFDLLDKLVEEYGIPIAIHNHGPGALYDKVDDVLTQVKDRHPKIGACVDTGHYLRSNEDPAEAIERLGKRVFGVHLKDVKSYQNEAEAEAFTKTGSARRQLKNEMKFFTLLGQGDLDIARCLQALQKLGYENSISVEYEENPDNPLSDLEVCLQTVREACAKLRKPA